MKRIGLDELLPYIAMAKKEGLLFSVNCDYYAYYQGEQIIGFCAIKYSGNKAIFKCSYVLKEYRGNGLLIYMTNFRKKVLKEKGIKYAEANCTKMSINTHLKCGAKIKKRYKNGITQVIYEIL
jgi:GNAT superfamily N-acetyltransferase